MSQLGKWFVLLVCLSAAALWLFKTTRIEQIQVPEKVKVKNILIWNSQHRVDSARFFGEGTEPFELKCPVKNCRLVNNYKELRFDQYDALVINMLDYEITTFPEELGFQRLEHQRYVFLTQESPVYSYVDAKRFNNYFNWTLSYRLDSDVLLLYGRIHPKESAPKNSNETRELIDYTHRWDKNYLANKTKSVAAMISNCFTDGMRETYIKELGKYIDVDIYGKCGNLACPTKFTDWLSHSECYDSLAGQYKFYLAFENAVCRDYVSEKFFLALSHNMVPVVYGGAKYSHFAPAHSFIDALQFTPRQLARYLRQVGNNATLYNEFFWWKDHYQVEAGADQMVRHAYCDLCRKLHEDNTKKVNKNITAIWSPFTQCAAVNTWEINDNKFL